MIQVLIKNKDKSPIKEERVKKTLGDFLIKEGVTGDVEVSVAFVGAREMIALAKKYLGQRNTLHNVLSFPNREGGEFVFAEEKKVYLGEIVVCFTKAFEESESQKIKVDDWIDELVCHSALHLMGKHHD